MSSANTQVDLVGLGGATQDFEEASGHINRTSSQMTNQVEALRGIWTGDASAVYLSAMNRWCEDFRAIAVDLEGLLHNVDGTKRLYTNVHANTEQTASRLQSAMGGLQGF